MTARAVEDEKALDRITFFSDAVFAIAMTLLVLDPLDGAPPEVPVHPPLRRPPAVAEPHVPVLHRPPALPTAVLGRDGGRAATVLYASAMSVTGVLSWLLT